MAFPEVVVADSITVKFPSGNIVHFGSGAGGGLQQVGVRGDIATKAGESFHKALGALGDVVAAMESAIGKLEHRPDGVEVEFSASLSGNADLWVVSGQGQAEFKVTLKWDKADAPNAAAKPAG